MNLMKFYANTLANNGATISLNTLNPGMGFFVSIKGHEMKRSIKNFTLDVLKNYIELHTDQLALEENFLGSWIEDGEVYLDISRHTFDERSAMILGRLNKQKAIYSIHGKKSIKVEKL